MVLVKGERAHALGVIRKALSKVRDSLGIDSVRKGLEQAFNVSSGNLHLAPSSAGDSITVQSSSDMRWASSHGKISARSAHAASSASSVKKWQVRARVQLL
jgi:hypothetical protein